MQKDRFIRNTSPGGLKDVEVGDEGTLAAVKFVMEELNLQSTSVYRAMAYDIMDAAKQVS